MLATELWTECLSFLSPNDLFQLLFADRRRHLLAEELLYRTILLRHHNRPFSPAKPQAVRALFEHLASPQGDRVVRLVRVLDAYWPLRGSRRAVSVALAAALPRMENLRVLRIGSTADGDLLEPLLDRHLWPRLTEAYFDVVVLPPSFAIHHPALTTLRSTFGIIPTYSLPPLGVSALHNISVTCPSDLVYFFTVKQPSVKRVDIVIHGDVVVSLAQTLRQCPAIYHVNFALTSEFDGNRLAEDVSLQIRAQITSVGVWMYPWSEKGVLGRNVGDPTGASRLIAGLAAAFPAMENLDLQFIGIIQDRLKDQRAISAKLAGIFEDAVHACTLDLTSLRCVSFGLVRTLVRSTADGRFFQREYDRMVCPHALIDGW